MQLFNALSYLHEHCIYHGDLIFENIFVTKSSSPEFKIDDFTVHENQNSEEAFILLNSPVYGLFIHNRCNGLK